MQIPPELMSPEQREERATKVEHETSREWLRFAVNDFALLRVPFGLFLLAYVATAAVPDFVPAIVAGSLCSILVLHWVNWRIATPGRARAIAASGDNS